MSRSKFQVAEDARTTAPDPDTPNHDAAGQTVHPAPAGDPQAALAAARAALDAMPGLTWRP